MLAYCSRCFKTRKLISRRKRSGTTIYCCRRWFLPSCLELSRIMCKKSSQTRGFSEYRIGFDVFSVEFFLYTLTESPQASFVSQVMLLGIGSKPFQTLWQNETRLFGAIRFFRPINHLFKKEENEHSILRNVRCIHQNTHFVDMRDDYWVTRFTRWTTAIR